MRHLVLVAVGKKDDKGNIFKPSREKATALPSLLRHVINRSTIFVYDGTSGAENTLRCVSTGAGLPNGITTDFLECDKLCPMYPDGPTYTEMAQSWRYLQELDAVNVVACMDIVYLRAFAKHLLGRDLRYQVEEADGVLINFGEDGKTPDSTELVSPYVG